MKRIFLLILFVACSGGSPNGTAIEPEVVDSGLRGYGVCRHEALIASVIYEESGYETRIMYGKMPDGEYHVQAQAKINGQWEWLSTRTIVVYVDDQDDFEPKKEYNSYEIYDNCVSGVWY